MLRGEYRMLLNNALEPRAFDSSKLPSSKYLFLTGKGGVGKTSTACAISVSLADAGKKVLLVSTDPASNLQDVFERAFNGSATPIPEVPGLDVVNLEPEEAARNYRESILGPYRGKMPQAVIDNMEEQLSGSCTVEIAAFDQFSNFITDPGIARKYDRIIFDTAPTGHTLRMLQLPSAWTNFISESTHGASCLGQLAGLSEKKESFAQAVKNLSDPATTSLVLVTRPEQVSLKEAERSSGELSQLGIKNQILVVNGLLSDGTDELSRKLFAQQQAALAGIPAGLAGLPAYSIALKAYNVLGIESIRALFNGKTPNNDTNTFDLPATKTLNDLIDDLAASGKKVIFTMGKGGVGKTTIAANIAKGLAAKGIPVLLTTTDPANHLKYRKDLPASIELHAIDEKAELERYKTEVLTKARQTMSENDAAYVEEDLRSPCTQEIAVFRAFAEIVERATDKVVVIDTAPTGHTLLLLDSTLSYHREVQRTKGEVPVSVQNLLPRLRDSRQTEIVIVTLPEATPVFEATRLKEDLERAGIHNGWWVVNQCLSGSSITNPLLKARAQNETKWIKRVSEISEGRVAVIALTTENKGE